MTSGRRIRLRKRRRSFPARVLSLLPWALSLQPLPAAAQARFAVPPSREARPAAPPWSGVGEVPPPSPALARVINPPVRHQAIHPLRDGARVTPLFPRAADVLAERRLREEAMLRHPAGKAFAGNSDAAGRSGERPPQVVGDDVGVLAGHTLGEPIQIDHEVVTAGAPRDEEPHGHSRWTGPERRHLVRSGDTLWDLGRAIVTSDDDSKIADCVTRIHRRNRSVIGPDPDLILPGQRLDLPNCKK